MKRNFSVSQINHYIGTLISNDIFLQGIRVEGEVCAFKEPSKNGHLYFEIKDENCRIKCIYFDIFNDYPEVPFKEGDKVILTGNIEVYEYTGIYQLVVKKIEIEGEGKLYKYFLELKQKLEAEGLFSITKRPLPKFPKKIGLITSNTGAAVHDVVETIKKRYPIVKIILYPVKVQGLSAASDIIKALDYMDGEDVDIVLITRGGGSYEELSVFNDENLARRIVKSEHPTVSAIGHAEDFFISDFVADIRANTPTAAAEDITPELSMMLDELYKENMKVNYRMNNILDFYISKLEMLNNSIKYTSPAKKIENRLLEIQNILKQFDNALKNKILKYSNVLDIKMNNSKTAMQKKFYFEKSRLNLINKTINSSTKLKFSHEQFILDNLESRIDILDLENLYNRGYSVTFDEEKTLIKDSDIIEIGKNLYTKLLDKTIVSKIMEVIYDEKRFWKFFLWR